MTCPLVKCLSPFLVKYSICGKGYFGSSAEENPDSCCLSIGYGPSLRWSPASLFWRLTFFTLTTCSLFLWSLVHDRCKDHFSRWKDCFFDFSRWDKLRWSLVKSTCWWQLSWGAPRWWRVIWKRAQGPDRHPWTWGWLGPLPRSPQSVGRRERVRRGSYLGRCVTKHLHLSRVYCKVWVGNSFIENTFAFREEKWKSVSCWN